MVSIRNKYLLINNVSDKLVIHFFINTLYIKWGRVNPKIKFYC